MKKLLVILLMIMLTIGLTACAKHEIGNTEVNSRMLSLTMVEEGDCYRIFVDDDTQVLYLWYKDLNNYGQTMTTIIKEDGTPKLLSDFNK